MQSTLIERRTWRLPSRWFLRSCCLAMLAIAAAGCAKFDLKQRIPWTDKDEVCTNPDRLTAVWTDTVLNTVGQPGIRGFGGRIMFFSRDSDEPVRVAGAVTVYAYDEDRGSDSAPDCKYVFSAEQLAAAYSKSNLGHSYSLWLPWDRAGGDLKQISLVARFEGDGGGVLLSEMTKHVLPGPRAIFAQQSPGATRPAAAGTALPPGGVGAVRPAVFEADVAGWPLDAHGAGGHGGGVQQAAHWEIPGAEASGPIDDVPRQRLEPRPRMSVETIEVPPAFGRFHASNRWTPPAGGFSGAAGNPTAVANTAAAGNMAVAANPAATADVAAVEPAVAAMFGAGPAEAARLSAREAHPLAGDPSRASRSPTAHYEPTPRRVPGGPIARPRPSLAVKRPSLVESPSAPPAALPTFPGR